MSLSREEKYELNQFGRRLLNEAGLNFEEGKDYDWLIKCRYVGIQQLDMLIFTYMDVGIE